jgi:hypothetical protein
VDLARERGPHGRFIPGSRAGAAKGGAAGRGRARLTVRLGMSGLPPDNAFLPYRKSATTFRRVQCAELARSVGGGMCGPMASSMVTSAALALAWSRYFSDQAALLAGTPTLAAEFVTKSVRYGEASRQHLMAAWEVCAKEAQSRPKKAPDLLGAFRAAAPADEKKSGE